MFNVTPRYYLLVLFLLFGCTRLPESKGSSKVSYLLNGQLVETYYTRNVLVIEPSKKGRNVIQLDSYAETGNFGFLVVSDSIVGNYTFANSFAGDYVNRIYFTPDIGSPGYKSSGCPIPQFRISISAYYPGQQTISGSFSGTVCNQDGQTLEITNGTFTFVKLYN